MSAHTKGPWSAIAMLSGSENDRGWAICCINKRIAEVSPLIYKDGDASAEGEANACLIAAAPDLLDCCTKALAAWEGTGPSLALDELRAAILKATGEAS